jgi:hypothetical protein
VTLPTQAEANEDFFARSKKEWAENGGFPSTKMGSVSSGSAGTRDADPGIWPDPRPLDDALPSVEAFTPQSLPEALRGWVMDVTERTQDPVEYVAVSAMVSPGAALGRRVAVRPKRLDDWIAQARIMPLMNAGTVASIRPLCSAPSTCDG